MSSEKAASEGFESRIPVRLSDIAIKLGVSTMTVSLALRSHPSISKARIAEVTAMAQQMGYRPNAMASALSHRKWATTKHDRATVLAWLNHWENPANLRNQGVFNLFWKAAANSADAFGYHLEEFIWGSDMSQQRLEKILVSRSIQGIIVPPHPRPPEWSGWNFDKFSVVRIGHSVSNLPVDMIATDQVRSGMLGYSRIWAHGYRRIGLVSSDWAARNTLFQAGYLLARTQMNNGKAMPMLNLGDQPGQNLAEDTVCLENWMRRVKPEAILTDMLGIGTLLKKLGYSVPDQVGVAMIGATPGMEAGILQNPEDVGRMAVETLISLIQRGVRGVPSAYRSHLASPSWVEGPTLLSRVPSGSELRK